MTRFRMAVYALGLAATLTSTVAFASAQAQAVSAAAQSFLATLTEEQRSATVLPLDTDERATWSNLPIIMVRPAGLLLKDMTAEQRRAAHALKSSSANVGASGISEMAKTLERRGAEESFEGVPELFSSLQGVHPRVCDYLLERARAKAA